MSKAVGPEWKQAMDHLKVLENAENTVEVARGYQECVRILEPAVKARTPVGATGTLKSSIKGEVRMSPRYENKVEGVVYTNQFYAHFVEMGTYQNFAGTRVRKLGGKRLRRVESRRGSLARYMFRWAWETNKQRCKEILGKSIGRLVGAWRGGSVRY